MKVLTYLLFVFPLFWFIKAADKGKNCHKFDWCKADLECHFYRCYTKAEWGLAKTNVDWSPNGNVCDWVHWCEKGYKCKENICVKKVYPLKPASKSGNLQQAKSTN